MSLFQMNTDTQSTFEEQKQSKVMEMKNQQQVVAVKYPPPAIPKIHDEEPACGECFCRCGYKGTTLTLAVWNGIPMLFTLYFNPKFHNFARIGFFIFYYIMTGFFIFYCIMTYKEPNACLAYVAAIKDTVLSWSSYIIAALFYFAAAFIKCFGEIEEVKEKILDLIKYILMINQNDESLSGFLKENSHIVMTTAFFICALAGIFFTLYGCFLQYIAKRFYAFEKYFRRKKEEEEKANAMDL